MMIRPMFGCTSGSASSSIPSSRFGAGGPRSSLGTNGDAANAASTAAKCGSLCGSAKTDEAKASIRSGRKRDHSSSNAPRTPSTPRMSARKTARIGGWSRSG